MYFVLLCLLGNVKIFSFKERMKIKHCVKSANSGKYGHEATQYSDTFHAVK